MASLIDRFEGEWKKVCIYIGMKVKEIDPRIDLEKFVAWMRLQEKYSPSGYKKGLFGDPNLYLHCFKVYEKLRSDRNQHHMVLVTGKIGKGKSTLGLQICAMIDPSFNMSAICYVPPHLFKRLEKCEETQANLVDEGGNFFKSRNAMSKLGKDISQAFQLVRDLKQLYVICYDEAEKLDKDILDKFDSVFVKEYHPEAKGGHKYRNYLGYNVKGFAKIKPLIHKKIPFTDVKITSKASWKGYNSVEIPIINDVEEGVYRSEKTKFIKQHMGHLGDKWKEDYKYSELDTEYISMGDARKIIPFHGQTWWNNVKSGKIPAKKFKGRWFIDKRWLNEQLTNQ